MKLRIFLLLSLLCLSISAAAKETWVSINSKNFIVISNAGERDARKITMMLEQFRHTLSLLLPQAKTRSAVPTKVILFKDQYSFRPFKPKYKGKIRDEIAGYFFSNGDESYIALATSTNTEITYRIIFHEYEHFIVGNNLLRAPVWLNEGLAEYYSTFRVQNDEQKAVIGTPIATHVALLRNAQLLPLSKLFEVDFKSPEYNETSRAGVFYAESWALVHYLMVGNQGKRRGQFQQFIDLLNSTLPVEESFRQAFQTDYRTIEEGLRDYISKFMFPAEVYTFADQLNYTKEVKLSSLTEPEVKLHLGDFLMSSRRLDEAESHLQSAVELNAKCAQCQIGLGMLRFHQQRFAEARKLLQSGLALDSQNYQGLHFYGKVCSEDEQYQEASNFYLQALRVNPNLANVYLDLSLAYIATGREQNAQEAFHRTLKLIPATGTMYRLRSYELLRMARGKQAADDSMAYIKMRGWRDTSAPYAAFAAYFGYRKDKLLSEADGLLDEMASKLNASEWPYPVIKYLKRNITAQQLISSAKDNDELTEAHAYLGMDLVLSENRDEGITHLQWVSEKGNRNFVEYRMALGELKRLRGSKEEKAR
jgi:lipoprotein NlpI